MNSLVGSVICILRTRNDNFAILTRVIVQVSPTSAKRREGVENELYAFHAADVSVNANVGICIFSSDKSHEGFARTSTKCQCAHREVCDDDGARSSFGFRRSAFFQRATTARREPTDSPHVRRSVNSHYQRSSKCALHSRSSHRCVATPASVIFCQFFN